MDEKFPRMLSDIEHSKLLIALAVKRGKKGFTDTEGYKLTAWAEYIEFQHTVIQLALKGQVLFDMKNDKLDDIDDITFSPTTSVLSKEGLDEHQKVLKEIEQRLGAQDAGYQRSDQKNAS